MDVTRVVVGDMFLFCIETMPLELPLTYSTRNRMAIAQYLPTSNSVLLEVYAYWRAITNDLFVLFLSLSTSGPKRAAPSGSVIRFTRFAWSVCTPPAVFVSFECHFWQ